MEYHTIHTNFDDAKNKNDIIEHLRKELLEKENEITKLKTDIINLKVIFKNNQIILRQMYEKQSNRDSPLPFQMDD